jgi:hypothetical protein
VRAVDAPPFRSRELEAGAKRHRAEPPVSCRMERHRAGRDAGRRRAKVDVEEGHARRKPSLTNGATTTPRTTEPWGSGASTGLATADPASSTTPPPAVVREGPWKPTPRRRPEP